MKSPFTIPSILFGLMVPATMLVSLWNLLAPPACCWLPAERAAWCVAISMLILLIACVVSERGASAKNAPRNAQHAADGKCTALTPDGVGEVSANAREAAN